MSRNSSTGQQHPGDLPAPGTAAMTSPAPGSAGHVHKRQLEKSVSWSGRERFRYLWYRLRLTVAEMNYATRRTVELQAPWISDNRPRHLQGTWTRAGARECRCLHDRGQFGPYSDPFCP